MSNSITKTITLLLFSTIMLGGCASYQSVSQNPYEPTIEKEAYPTIPDDVRLYLSQNPLPKIGDSKSPLNQAYGAPVQILFANGSYEINSAYNLQLMEISNILKEQPGTEAVLYPHTSEIGGEELNDKLAKNRGLAVKKELLRLSTPYDQYFEKRISVVIPPKPTDNKADPAPVSVAEHHGDTQNDLVNTNRSVTILIRKI